MHVCASTLKWTNKVLQYLQHSFLAKILEIEVNMLFELIFFSMMISIVMLTPEGPNMKSSDFKERLYNFRVWGNV